MKIKVQNKLAVLTILLNRDYILMSLIFNKVHFRKVNNDISNLKLLGSASVNAACVSFEFNNCM